MFRFIILSANFRDRSILMWVSIKLFIVGQRQRISVFREVGTLKILYIKLNV